MRLLELSTSRENNLNLIRFLAASAVLFSHCFVLSTGSPSTEPFRSQIGMTLGSIAVDIFFLISGFLVAASLCRSQSIVDFVVARSLRILPGLLIMLIITVFCLGAAMTNMPLKDYLTSNQTYKYFFRCTTLVFGMEFQLPGVFETNPYKFAVNGSLWTLRYEISMYGTLAMFWIILAMVGKRRLIALDAACVTFAIISGVYLIYKNLSNNHDFVFIWLFFMFFTGVSYFSLRNYIKLSIIPAVMLVGVLLITSQISKAAFTISYLICVSYILFYLCCTHNKIILRYNKIGDFSYGIYIYAFPIQQTIIALAPGILPLTLFVWSLSITLGISIISWTAVEKQALRLKRPIVSACMQWLGYEYDGKLWRRSVNGIGKPTA